jgi:excinuclease ABC subunit A
MQFLSDLYLTCSECNGTRFTRIAESYRYHEKSVVDFLRLTASEAMAFLEGIEGLTNKENLLLSKTRKALQPLVETGLGYLRLGQPLNTLSGGEAQRLKLCRLLTST